MAREGATRRLYRPWCIIAVLLSLVGVSYEQYPVVCITNGNLRAQKCCPPVSIRGVNMECGGPGRGSCTQITNSHCHVERPNAGIKDVMTYLKNKTLEPSRYPWTTRVFTQICECQGNWAGYDCDECKFGFVRVLENNTDAVCVERRTPLLRRNYQTLSQEEQRDVIQVVANSRDRAKSPSRFAALVDESHFSDSIDTPSALTKADFKTDLSTYEFMAWLHYYAAKDSGTAPINQPEYKTKVDFAHESSTFLVWHRYYLLFFETELQRVANDSSFALPYWDWLNQTDEMRDQLFSNFNVYDGTATGVGGAFENFSVTCHDAAFALDAQGELGSNDSLSLSPNRGNGSLCNRTQFDSSNKIQRNYGPNSDETQFLPSLRDVWDIYSSTSQYDSPSYNAGFDQTSNTLPTGFRNALEGFQPLPDKRYCDIEGRNNTVHEIHNAVHIYVGGTMGNVAASTNDPIFWMHHCMVDRVFEKFIVKLANAGTLTYIPVRGAAPGHNADDCMVPFFPLHRNKDYLKISTDFGYEYDNLPNLDKEPERPAEEYNQCNPNLPSKVILSPVHAATHSNVPLIVGLTVGASAFAAFLVLLWRRKAGMGKYDAF